MPTTSFYFGRLNFKHQLTNLEDYDEELEKADQVRRALWEYVNTEGIVYRERSEEQWVFGFCMQEDGMIFGKFGKIFQDQPTTYDFDQGDFIDENERSTKADYSAFFIYPEQNLIVFNTRQHIGYRQFPQAFAKGYSRHVGLEKALTINLLQDSGDVKELIDTSKVKYATFDLVPTNPTNSPDMAILDNHIQQMEADSFGMKAESDGEINMDDDLMQAALNMSTAGYGQFQLEYERDNQRQRYHSAERPAAHEEERPETLADLQTIVDNLKGRAHSLLRSQSND